MFGISLPIYIMRLLGTEDKHHVNLTLAQQSTYKNVTLPIISSQQDKNQQTNTTKRIKQNMKKTKTTPKTTATKILNFPKKALAPHGRLMFQQCLVTSEFPLAAKAARRRPRQRWQRQEILRRRRDRGIMPWNVAEDVAEGGAG